MLHARRLSVHGAASPPGASQFRFETNRRTRESCGFGNSAISGLVAIACFILAWSMEGERLAVPAQDSIPSATATVVQTTNLKAAVWVIAISSLWPTPRERCHLRVSRGIQNSGGRPWGFAKRGPPFATGVKSREVTAVRRHHDGRPIRLLDDVPQFTQWRPKRR